MKFALIDAEKANFPIGFMCRQLGVSRSGYYAWQGRAPSNREVEDRRLAIDVAAAFRASKGRYGSPRVHADIKAQGTPVARKRVERIMREQGLRARKTRQFKRTTQSDHSERIAPNILDRNFQQPGPNTAWVTDITYIRTGEGWLYLVAILDLFSRRVVGWDTSDRLDADFCCSALRKALKERQPAPGLVLHADQGVQFASEAFRSQLESWEGVLSMSRRGNCWDNAVAESFWSTVKAELVEESVFITRASARAALFEYIEAFYNRRRRHSRLAYRTPVEHEHLARQTALAA